MELVFEIQPTIGIGPLKLGMCRKAAIQAMGLEPESFMKTPFSAHPTDAFFEAGFQVFYEGEAPVVESIELSRDCGFIPQLYGINVLGIPVDVVLLKIEKAAGVKPETEDDGYTYEIQELGLWLWRQSNEPDGDQGAYFDTVGVGKPC